MIIHRYDIKQLSFREFCDLEKSGPKYSVKTLSSRSTNLCKNPIFCNYHIQLSHFGDPPVLPPGFDIDRHDTTPTVHPPHSNFCSRSSY